MPGLSGFAVVIETTCDDLPVRLVDDEPTARRIAEQVAANPIDFAVRAFDILERPWADLRYVSLFVYIAGVFAGRRTLFHVADSKPDPALRRKIGRRLDPAEVDYGGEA